MTDAVRTGIERVFREEYARSIAMLVRSCGGIDAAEEAVADAFLQATERWPHDGMPPNPGAWIVTTARRRAIDRHRRESQRETRHLAFASTLEEPGTDAGIEAVPDEMLRLLFTCCHPALAQPAQVALALRLLGGLSTAEIARAFLVAEPTMAQRIVRAKAKIREARIPWHVPDAHELPARVAGVLAVIYLVFNEGYVASSGADLLRVDLCTEAIRLARLVVQLLPQEPEAQGLLALLLLVHARRATRTYADGALVPLHAQDRAQWDRAMVREGQDIVRRCLAHNTPGPYQVQAAIQAVHHDAGTVADTDWPQVLALYDQLAAIAPSPVVTLNRAVAVAEVHGAEAALQSLTGTEEPLAGFHLAHAVRADLLARAGRHDDAIAAYDMAITLTGNGAERRHLQQARARLTDGRDA